MADLHRQFNRHHRQQCWIYQNRHNLDNFIKNIQLFIVLLMATQLLILLIQFLALVTTNLQAQLYKSLFQYFSLFFFLLFLLFFFFFFYDLFQLLFPFIFFGHLFVRKEDHHWYSVNDDNQINGRACLVTQSIEYSL